MVRLETLKSQELAEAVCRDTILLIQRTTFSISEGRDKTRLALFLCSVEYADSILESLSHASVNMSIVPVFRAAFEAWRDLSVLTADKSHLFRMEKSFLKSKRQVLRAQINFAQSDPKTAPRIQGLNIELDEVKIRLDAPDLTDLQDEDVFAKKWNDNGVFAMLWPMLCDLSHNNLNALAIRHLPEHDVQGNKLLVFVPIDNQFRALILNTQVMMLITGLESLRPLVKQECIANFEESFKKIDTMWRLFLDLATETNRETSYKPLKDSGK